VRRKWSWLIFSAEATDRNNAVLQFELNALAGETHRNSSFGVGVGDGDASERHLSGPIGAVGEDANNHTKFTSAASEYFK
jgi:hypothetical protein